MEDPDQENQNPPEELDPIAFYSKTKTETPLLNLQLSVTDYTALRITASRMIKITIIPLLRDPSLHKTQQLSPSKCNWHLTPETFFSFVVRKQ
jgi:hypothetical protein